jgi:hypothetical protein
MSMSESDVKSEARGTLNGWLDGYTEPDDKQGIQHRIRLVDIEDESDIYSAAEVTQIGTDDSTAELFRVTVTVERIDQQ